MTRVATIDLFAGAGGLGLGSRMAGADLRLSVDNDADSCLTLRANKHLHGGDVLECDIVALTGSEIRERASLAKSDPLLIVGGVPCQPFSKAAYWLEEGQEAAFRRARADGTAAEKPSPPKDVRPDSRRTLVQEYWRIVLEADADAFVFENVRGILHPRNRPVLEALIDDAHQEGFATTLIKANAAEYGVPQLRQRVFVVGSRSAKPTVPHTTHCKPDLADSTGLLPYETCGPTLKPFRTRRYAEPEEVVTGRWAEHLRTVPPGWNYKAHTAWGGHPNPTFVTETRYWNFLLKLSPDKPSWTLNASPGPWTGPFHWDSRRLRTPEMAALQTFPAEYVFAGSRRERVRQIGNAVPPLLAQVMVGSALGTLGMPELTARLRAAA